jgi:hypothetical protein
MNGENDGPGISRSGNIVDLGPKQFDYIFAYCTCHLGQLSVKNVNKYNI